MKRAWLTVSEKNDFSNSVFSEMGRTERVVGRTGFEPATFAV
jgi:hypothetical protein